MLYYTQPPSGAPARAEFMCGFYYHFNNLRFQTKYEMNSHRVCVDTCSCLFVSSEIQTCRLSKRLLDHPVRLIGLTPSGAHSPEVNSPPK